MPGPEFFQTRMGTRFYEVTMPKIADQLERLNKNIEALIALQSPVGRCRHNNPINDCTSCSHECCDYHRDGGDIEMPCDK